MNNEIYNMMYEIEQEIELVQQNRINASGDYFFNPKKYDKKIRELEKEYYKLEEKVKQND